MLEIKSPGRRVNPFAHPAAPRNTSRDARIMIEFKSFDDDVWAFVFWVTAAEKAKGLRLGAGRFPTIERIPE